MSVYYDFYETPVSEGEEPKPLHARVRSKGTISGKDFMNQVFREEHMPHAMYYAGYLYRARRLAGGWLYGGDRRAWILQHLVEVYPACHDEKRYSCRVNQNVYGEISSRRGV